jgi:hypothetical protein
MAVKTKPQSRKSFARRVVAALRKGLATAGVAIDEVETEPIRGTRLIRVTLLSRGFEHVNPLERQTLVWRILNQVLTPEERLQLIMVLTLTPSELVGT